MQILTGDDMKVLSYIEYYVNIYMLNIDSYVSR